MKIRIESDIHLEFDSTRRIYNTTGADVLILAGDIFVAQDLLRTANSTKAHLPADIKDFFAKVAKEFKHVVYVMGNHEHYHGRFNETPNIIKKFLKKFPNIHFLKNNHVDIDGYLFYGGTMWTDFGQGNAMALQMASYYMNDFRIIKDNGYLKLQAETAYREHLTFKDNLIKILKENRPTIVVSHHAPSFLSVDPAFKSDRHTNWYYCSELYDFIQNNPQIKLWAHGHIHASNDYLINTTRIVSNPQGYPMLYGNNLNYKVQNVRLD